MKNITIQETNNYDQFKFLKGNRNISQSHLAQLTTVILNNNMLEFNPILVNKEMEVIDGQHRLMVARNNKLPIYFIVNPNAGLKEVRIQNTFVRNWRITDFIESYVALGYPDYIWFYEQMTNNRLAYSNLIIFIYGFRGDHHSPSIKRGEFKVANFEKKRAEERIKKLQLVSPYINFKGGINRSFLLSLIEVMDGEMWKDFYRGLEESQKTFDQPRSIKEADLFIKKIIK